MRAALDELAAAAARDGAARRVAVLGDMLELGPTERELPPRARRVRPSAAASTCWSRSARWRPAIAERFGGEAHASPTPPRPPRSCPGCCAPATWCSSRARAASASSWCARRSEPGADRAADGSALRAGADRAAPPSLLMCLFLSPKFIEFLRHREFGQNIREEGPQGHQTKAGTPTMGGIIIMVAFAVPFLILVQARLAVARRVRGGDRLRGARLRRRLHEDRQAALARPARAHQAGRHGRDLARAVVGRDPEGRHRRRRSGSASSTARSTSGRSTRVHLPGGRRARPAQSTSPTASTAWRPAAPRSSLLAYIGITFITPASTT